MGHICSRNSRARDLLALCVFGTRTNRFCTFDVTRWLARRDCVVQWFHFVSHAFFFITAKQGCDLSPEDVAHELPRKCRTAKPRAPEPRAHHLKDLDRAVVDPEERANVGLLVPAAVSVNPHDDAWDDEGVAQAKATMVRGGWAWAQDDDNF